MKPVASMTGFASAAPHCPGPADARLRSVNSRFLDLACACRRAAGAGADAARNHRRSAEPRQGRVPDQPRARRRRGGADAQRGGAGAADRPRRQVEQSLPGVQACRWRCARVAGVVETPGSDPKPCARPRPKRWASAERDDRKPPARRRVAARRAARQLRPDRDDRQPVEDARPTCWPRSSASWSSGWSRRWAKR